jgi:hypothetical protein
MPLCNIRSGESHELGEPHETGESHELGEPHESGKPCESGEPHPPSSATLTETPGSGRPTVPGCRTPW